MQESSACALEWGICALYLINTKGPGARLLPDRCAWDPWRWVGFGQGYPYKRESLAIYPYPSHLPASGFDDMAFRPCYLCSSTQTPSTQKLS